MSSKASGAKPSKKAAVPEEPTTPPKQAAEEVEEEQPAPATPAPETPPSAPTPATFATPEPAPAPATPAPLAPVPAMPEPVAVRSQPAAAALKIVETALETLSLAAKPYIAKAQDGIVYIRVQVGEAIVLIKTKVEDSPATQKLKAYGTKVAEVVEPKVLAVQAKVGDAAVVVKAKVAPFVETSVAVRDSVEKSIAMAKAKAAEKYSGARTAIVTRSEPVVVMAKGKYMYVSGRVGDAVIYVRAKKDSSKALALERYANAVKRIDGYTAPAVANVAQLCDGIKVKAVNTIEPVRVRVKDGVVYVQGKVGDTKVFLKSKVEGVVSAANSTLETYCKPMLIKVQGGYLYVTGRVGDAVLFIQTEVVKTINATKAKALTTYGDARRMIGDRVAPVVDVVAERYGSARAKALMIADESKIAAIATMDKAKAKAAVAATNVKSAAAEPKFQATAGAAASGAVALGASGGATGLAVGGTIGAAVGVVPALFTFGLSIPIGAAIGAVSGLTVGTAAGSTVGLAAGGAVGYGVHAHKDEIGSSVSGAVSKVSAAKEYVKDKTMDTTHALRARLVGGTGGTD